MAVIVKNGALIPDNAEVLYPPNSVKLGGSGYLQLLFLSFLFCYPSYSHATPAGGHIVGGSGTINQTASITNITQHSSSLAIDWNSYNIQAHEIVNYLQPGQSSIALNRILDNSASHIHGQINANGQVILVNPNGLFFSPTASINVGGLIASGLDINPVDFMNGDYTFRAVDGSSGIVSNGGILNASLGGRFDEGNQYIPGNIGKGSIALIGKQVINQGIISANLGAISLAAGQEAVLTFDNEGLLGVRISKEILQDELGVDPAVLNNGEISAKSGRVLLTASQSQDVFSRAVNTGDIAQATSVVVNNDGSFTLGSGADIKNNGAINVSAEVDNASAGQVVILGENITHSGTIQADGFNQQGGQIEVHAHNTNLFTETSQTSASSAKAEGGTVKALGHWVGIKDNSAINTSGATAGGQIFVGGDFQGKNLLMRNAQRTFIGRNTQLVSDALSLGDGGTVIVWADESTQYYGNVLARGGSIEGDGGFAEISGKQGLIFDGDVDLSVTKGEFGTLLLDPKNITISDDSTSHTFPSQYNQFSDLSGQDTILNNTDLSNRLSSNFAVNLFANNDIIIENSVTSTGAGNLTLNAGRTIEFTNGADVILDGGAFTAIVDFDNDASGDVFFTDRDAGAAAFTMSTGSTITTNGGNISITTQVADTNSADDGDGSDPANNIGNFSLQTISSTGSADNNAGSIVITNHVGDITVNNNISANGGSATNNNNGLNAMPITLTAGGSVNVLSAIAANGSNGGTQTVAASPNTAGGNASTVTINVGAIYTQSANISSQAGSAGTGGTGGGGSGSLSTITINGDDTANTFNVNAGSTYTGSPVTFNMQGAADIFNINAAITATVNGGLGTNTLNGRASNINTWNISSTNAGTVSNSGGGSIGFSNFQNLVGGLTANDLFTVQTGINISGSIDGNGGTNTLSKVDGNNAWVLTDAFDGTLNGDSFDNIQTINGGSGDDTLTGRAQANTWNITAGSNQGNVANTSSPIDSLSFTGMENLSGSGNFADNFVFVNNSDITGLIDGAGGNDTLDIRNLSTDQTVELVDNSSASDIHATDIENITANTAQSNTLIGPNGLNAWSITSTNGGVINSTINFSGFNDLTGGTQTDNFVIENNIIFNGDIGGGDGSDTITLNTNSMVTGSIDGGDGSDTLTRIDGTNAWVLSSANGGTLTGTGGFSNIENLGGGSGDDTLTGRAQDNQWDITASNAGTVANAVSPTDLVNFTGMENLTGANLDDNFVFTIDSSDITGLIDGGTGTDTIDISAFTTNQTVELIDNNLTTHIHATSVEVITGNVARSHTLIGDNTNNEWSISADDAGDIDGTIDFTGFANLTGGSQTDNFDIENNVTLSGFINAGDGTDSITLNTNSSITGSIDGGGGDDTLARTDGTNAWALTSANAGTLTGTGGFSNIENLEGGSGDDTLTGRAQGNQWDITGTNAGSVANAVSPTDLVNFTGMENLTGANLNDNFVFTIDSSDITGLIDGGTGTDTIDISAFTTNQTVELIDNNLTTHIHATSVEVITGNVARSHTLIGSNAGSTWAITSSNGGNIDSVINFTGFANLTGGSGDDSFELSGTGALTGAIDGGGGNNNVTGRSDVTNDWIISAADTANVTNIAGTLTNIQTLTGGTGNDNFSLTGTGDWSGSIEGNGGINSLTARNDLVNNWDISGADAGLVTNVGGFNNIQNLIGGGNTDNFDLSTNASSISGSINGGAGTNTITGRDTDTLWQITTGNGGRSEDGSMVTIINAFTNIQNLTGGISNDDFELSGTGSLGGSIDGGLGSNSLKGRDGITNSWNISAVNGGTATNIGGTFANIQSLLGGDGIDIYSLSGVGSILSIDGDGGINRVVAANSINNWAITGADSGSVDGITNFINIQQLEGNAASDTFVLSGSGAITGYIDGNGGTDTLEVRDGITNVWDINGSGAGDVTNVAQFLGMENLEGGDGNDQFGFSASGAITGTIDGDGGINTITARGTINTWQITTNNAGNLTNTGGFSNIQNLTGGSSVDTFEFSDGAGIDGLINGGDGIDTVNLTAITTNIDVEVGNTTTQNIAVYKVFQVEQLNADTNGDALTNQLTADNIVNTWDITGNNSGALNTTLNFSGFNLYIGNTQNDVFNLFNGGRVPVNGIDGGGGFNTANGSTFVGTLDFYLGNNGFSNFDLLIGNNTASNLYAANGGSNVWEITGENDGAVAGIEFQNFNNLFAGDSGDTFNVSGSGSLLGTATGGIGNDIVELTLTGAENGVFTFNGVDGSDNDTVNLTGGNANYSGQYSADTGGFEQLAYTQDGNAFILNYTNAESINDNLTASILTINGGTGNDTIDLGSAQFAISSSAAALVNFANKNNLTVNGQGGVDVIDFVQNVNLGSGTLTLTAETVTNTTNSNVVAGNLVLEGVVNAGTSSNRINTTINNLSLINTTGDVFINEANQISLDQLTNVTGTLDLVNQTGDILDSTILTSAVNLSLDAQNGNIILDDANQLSGELSLNALNGNVNLTNAATQLATVNTQNLTITSTGNITDTTSSAISVTGTTSLTANGQDIILDGNAHQFTNLSISNTNNATINDANTVGITVNQIDVINDLNLTASGTVSLNSVNAGNLASLTTSSSINDNNADESNIIASSVQLRAASGIGENNAIETVTSSLDVENSSSGKVEIENTGSVTLVALKNLGTTGDISIANDADYNINPGSIDAGYNTGELIMTTVNGGYLGIGPTPDFSNADITARAGTFFGLAGTFGTTQRPLVLNIRDSALIQTRASLNPRFAEPRPIVNDESLLQFSGLDTLAAIAGEQLVEVETLGEIDQAIFTELQNFNMEETSIRMPRDQLFEDEIEERDAAQ